eukprot:3936036-Rhodomonas_salina.1
MKQGVRASGPERYNRTWMLMIHNELASCNVLNLIMINHVSSSHHHARSSSRSILKMIRTRGGGASRQLGKGG